MGKFGLAQRTDCICTILETEKIKLFLSDAKNENTLSSNRIHTIHQDKSGEIWVGTKNDGINLFVVETQSFIRFPNEIDVPYANTVNQIRSAGLGMLWVGTEAGLFKFSKQTKTFKYIQNASKHAVHAILADGDYIWLGTPHGLVKYHEVKDQVKEYTTRNGLPINQVESLLADSEGMIWIATTKGLSKFNSETEIFRNYDKDDGLQSNIFNARAAFKSVGGNFTSEE